MDLTPVQIKQFQERILSWYKIHKRDLPWRKTRDPYAILISEVMSQQTQIGRVIPKYEAWLKRFPTLQELAVAPVSEVLRFWSGLGYNSRALNLQKTVKILTEQYSSSGARRSATDNDSRAFGQIASPLVGISSRRVSLARTINWPKTTTELEKLPGIGKYTAAAIACFAFNVQIPVIDTNVRKVIIVELGEGVCHCEELKKTTKQSHKKDCHVSPGTGLYLAPLAMTEKDIEAIAWQILPQGRADEWNQALMDYSSLVLKDKKIPIAKQSNFLSSDRYYRGQTVKLLLEIKSISVTGLLDYFGDRNPIESSRLTGIVESMRKDGLIVFKKQKLSLPA